MSQDTQRVVVDEVNVDSVVQFPKIWRAVTWSMRPTRLAIGLIMVFAIMTFGTIWDEFAPATFHRLGLRAGSPSSGGVGPFASTAAAVSENFDKIVDATLSLRPAGVFDALERTFIYAPRVLWVKAPWFVVFFTLFIALVLAIGGGALSRLAASDMAQRDRLRAGDAVLFGCRSWLRLVSSLLLPLLLTGILCVILATLGLVLMLPWLDVIGGLLYGLLLLIGALIAFLLLGYAVAWPLLIPAVACENCDAGDALQRAYAYTLTRPLRLIGYGANALLGLAGGFLIVAIAVGATIGLTAAIAGWWSGNPVLESAGGAEFLVGSVKDVSDPDWAWHHTFAARTIRMWLLAVQSLVVAWVLSYFFNSATIVYLLMRRVVDGQEPTEIWQPGLIPGTQTPRA